MSPLRFATALHKRGAQKGAMQLRVRLRLVDGVKPEWRLDKEGGLPGRIHEGRRGEEGKEGTDRHGGTEIAAPDFPPA